MPLVVFHTRRVREALKAPTTFTLDLIILVVVCALIGALFKYGGQVTAQYQEKTVINLSLVRVRGNDLHRASMEHGLQLPRRSARHPVLTARSSGDQPPPRKE